MADYRLVDNPDATVFGVDADGVSYVLRDVGFTTSTSDFEVIMV